MLRTQRTHIRTHARTYAAQRNREYFLTFISRYLLGTGYQPIADNRQAPRLPQPPPFLPPLPPQRAINASPTTAESEESQEKGNSTVILPPHPLSFSTTNRLLSLPSLPPLFFSFFFSTRRMHHLLRRKEGHRVTALRAHHDMREVHAGPP